MGRVISRTAIAAMAGLAGGLLGMIVCSVICRLLPDVLRLFLGWTAGLLLSGPVSYLTTLDMHRGGRLLYENPRAYFLLLAVWWMVLGQVGYWIILPIWRVLRTRRSAGTKAFPVRSPTSPFDVSAAETEAKTSDIPSTIREVRSRDHEG